MTKARLMNARLLRAAIIGGLVGGIVLAAFIIPITAARSHQTFAAAFATLAQVAASAAVGKATAASSPSFIWVGVGVYAVVCMCWAGSYAYVANSRPQILAQPGIWGFLFGFMVWLIMQLILVAAGLFEIPSPDELEIELVGYCIFFGIPLGYTVARLR